MGDGMTGSPMTRVFLFGRNFGTLIALSFAVAVPAFFIVHSLEQHLVLAALSVLFFGTAALAAIMALSIKTKKNSENLNLWDVAGGLVITGCAASVMGEPEQVVQLFEHLFERRTYEQ
jgi:ethanolamine utilization microcompartment shell protein EutS